MSLDSSIQEAAAALEVALDRIQTEHEGNRGACVDCKWFSNTCPSRRIDWNTVVREWYTCKNPLVAVPVYDHKMGDIAQPIVTAKHARSEKGLCGVNGKLFEPRVSPVTSLWRRILRNFWE